MDLAIGDAGTGFEDSVHAFNLSANGDQQEGLSALVGTDPVTATQIMRKVGSSVSDVEKDRLFWAL